MKAKVTTERTAEFCRLSRPPPTPVESDKRLIDFRGGACGYPLISVSPWFGMEREWETIRIKPPQFTQLDFNPDLPVIGTYVLLIGELIGLSNYVDGFNSFGHLLHLDGLCGQEFQRSRDGFPALPVFFCEAVGVGRAQVSLVRTFEELTVVPYTLVKRTEVSKRMEEESAGSLKEWHSPMNELHGEKRHASHQKPISAGGQRGVGGGGQDAGRVATPAETMIDWYRLHIASESGCCRREWKAQPFPLALSSGERNVPVYLTRDDADSVGDPNTSRKGRGQRRKRNKSMWLVRVGDVVVGSRVRCALRPGLLRVRGRMSRRGRCRRVAFTARHSFYVRSIELVPTTKEPH
uniref:Uncharacterized protein n=1 Tax=Timema bartmani TaxID=61472 RepID=A0A7R9EP41_9NEOP|nr:unnamed protein product [Timema bartmani]